MTGSADAGFTNPFDTACMRTKGILRKFISASVLGGAMTAVYVAGAWATPGSGFTSVDISKGRFDEIAVATDAAPPHQVWLLTKTNSDFYVVENTVTPGGFSGWHTHPGPSLVTVKSGTATFYEGDDPTCTPRVHQAGSGFIDKGDGHVHIVRNEGNVDLVLITVQLFPADTPQRRMDVLDPGNCAF
jgi:quercetin dioxygenase-like cupin family protein